MQEMKVILIVRYIIVLLIYDIRSMLKKYMLWTVTVIICQIMEMFQAVKRLMIIKPVFTMILDIHSDYIRENYIINCMN